MFLFLLINPQASKQQYINILVIADSESHAKSIKPDFKNAKFWPENKNNLIVKNLGMADPNHISKYKTPIVATTFIA